MSESFAMEPVDAWVELDRVDHDAMWAAFRARFGFRAGMTPDDWPAISEPAPSFTFDLSEIADGARRGSAYDAVNTEALRAFVWALPEQDELIVLDWQHPAYRFRPAAQALAWAGEWKVPVHPDGDYYAFFTPDLAEGTFGHPWEKSLCVVGPKLCASLGASLATWLPVKRRDGVAPPAR